MIKTILTIAGILTAGLSSAQVTKVLTAEKSNEYGIVYTLPNTALEVEVTATHKVARKGPFFQYAKKYLGASDVVKEDYETWTLTDVKVRPYGVPDTESQYLMQLRPGALTYIEVDADGMLLAINKETGSSVASRSRTQESQATVWPTGKEYLKFVDEEFVASKSSQKQAQILAEALMEVRESKLALTRGTADAMPADGKQMELMLASLGEQEDAMTAAFTGTVTSESVTRTFTYMPMEETKEILFRMSSFAGFAEADDLSGAPVYITVSDVVSPGMPIDAKGQPKKLPRNAVIYNIPGSALITLTADGHSYYEQEIQLAQFGTTFGLDPALFTDKKEPSFATFDPVTGALIEVGLQK